MLFSVKIKEKIQKVIKNFAKKKDFEKFCRIYIIG